ncbi:tail fiber assembly protein [Serratia marcescens]|uniref:tail fiber assembly protein n=1 Tax=Serratia marcescens TaxID=615 RepID=UPI003AAECD4E
MGYFYSASTGGFYNDVLIDVYGESWPSDVISITESDYDKLMESSRNKQMIIANENGYPIAALPPVPTKEQVEYQNAKIISELMTRATNDIVRIQDAIDFDGGTDQERATLILLKKYRVLLGRVEVSSDSELNLPEYPS